MEDLANRLTEKSIEAFILGLEIYNKPTIKYRIEGFSFFIVNAWELMLKATLLKRGESIYFSDKPDRTLSVENVVKKIYTDKNTRIRLNLEKIIELRNINLKDPSDTHKYSYKNVITAVQERLKKKNVKLGYSSGFTQYVLNLIMDFYNIKQNPTYAYEHVIGNQHSFTYSQQFVDFIVAEIEKNPQKFVESLKKSK